MNKKIISAVLAATLLTPITIVSAKAATPAPSIAILDTGIDSTVPSINSKLIYEACILGWDSCANGKSFMEGPGAAALPKSIIFSNGWDHGTLMASVAIKANPNVNIVFVRVIGNTPTGGRQIVNESALTKAFEWVLLNKDKFNIQAVGFSQGRRDILVKSADYCPKTVKMRSVISRLVSSNVPTFAATGNNRDYNRIDWPSCIQDTISVGATTEQDEIAIYSNMDNKIVDFVARGTIDDVSGPGNISSRIAGTSASAQVAASQWVALRQAKPNLTYSQLYDLFSKTSVKAVGPSNTFGKLINLEAAING